MIINGISYHHSDVDSVFIFNSIRYLFFCLDGSLRTGFIYSLFNFNSCTCCGFCIKNEKHYKNLAALRIYQTNNIFFLFLFSCLFFLLYFFFQPCMGGLECVCVCVCQFWFCWIENHSMKCWKCFNKSINRKRIRVLLFALSAIKSLIPLCFFVQHIERDTLFEFNWKNTRPAFCIYIYLTFEIMFALANIQWRTYSEVVCTGFCFARCIVVVHTILLNLCKIGRGNVHYFGKKILVDMVVFKIASNRKLPGSSNSREKKEWDLHYHVCKMFQALIYQIHAYTMIAYSHWIFTVKYFFYEKKKNSNKSLVL